MNKCVKLLKRNTVPLISILLAIIIAVGGFISYAKFISDENGNGASSIGFFSYSASIDGVSALSFTNTAFWGTGLDGDFENLVAMNAIRTIDFSINNFEGEKVNTVRTGYSMTFTSPKIFAESLAFQIIDNDGSAMLPQIVVSDILTKNAFSTEDSVDYNGQNYIGDVYDKNGDKVLANAIDGNDLYFTVSKSTVNDMTAYTATASTPNGKVIVSVTPKMETKEQTLNFRLWDISQIVMENPAFNAEGGTLLSPLTIVLEETQVYYDITVTTPDFMLPAGVKTTNKHTMRLVPTTVLDDTHLGGLIIDKTTDNAAETLYSGQQLMLQSTHENIKVYANSGKTELLSDISEPVFGSIKVYNAGSSSVINAVSPTVETTVKPDVSNVSSAYSNTGWSTTKNWYEESRTGEGSNYTANMKKLEQRTLVFIVYEQTSVSDHVITTEVLSVSGLDSNGNQASVSLMETTETVTTIEKRPVGTVTVIQEREVMRKDVYVGGVPETGAVSTGDPYVVLNEESVYVPNDVMNEESVSAPQISTVYKDISRHYEKVDVVAKTVSYTPIKADGTYGDTTVYTSSSPFSTHAGTPSMRKYYVSQSFSKSYPLSVNITFEQRANK